jgi:hypothetical protein
MFDVGISTAKCGRFNGRRCRCDKRAKRAFFYLALKIARRLVKLMRVNPKAVATS